MGGSSFWEVKMQGATTGAEGMDAAKVGALNLAIDSIEIFLERLPQLCVVVTFVIGRQNLYSNGPPSP